MKKIFVLAAAVVASASALAFQPGMSESAFKAEVGQRVQQGESLTVIAAAGKSGGMSVEAMLSALEQAGHPSADAVAALINAGYPASSPLLMAKSGASTPDLGNSGNGIINSSFGQARAASVGGGGRGGVSPN